MATREHVHDFDGKKYAQFSAHQTDWGTELAATLNLQGMEHILDLGCGDGRTTAHLASLVPQGCVVGIDASPGMIQAAQSHASENCTFQEMDMRELPFSERFDVVFSNAALHWITDQPTLVRRIYQALRPGGVFVADFAAAGNSENFLRTARSVMRDGQFREAFADFQWPWCMPEAETFRAALEQAGFSSAAVEAADRDQRFADAEALAGWIDQPCIVPFLEALPADLKKPFRDRVVRETAAAAAQTDGSCVERFRRLRVKAVK